MVVIRGINCSGSARITPLPFDGELIKEQIDEVGFNLRKRGGSRAFSGEAVNKVIAHCIESDLSRPNIGVSSCLPNVAVF